MQDTFMQDFHMLSSVDRAIMRNIPIFSHRFLKYGHEHDKELLKLLNENAPICSISGMEKLIISDDTDAVSLLMKSIGYKNEETPIKLLTMPWLHICITFKFCMTHDSINIFTELFKHEYVQRVLMEELKTPKLLSINGYLPLFLNLKVPSRITDMIFHEDSWIMKQIEKLERGQEYMYESIIIGALRRRDYETIHGLYRLKGAIIENIMENCHLKTRGKPEQQFIKCSRIFYRYSHFLDDVHKFPIVDAYDSETSEYAFLSKYDHALLNISRDYNLHEETLILLYNKYGHKSHENDVFKSMEKIEQSPDYIINTLLHGTLSEEFIRQIQTAIKNDNRRDIISIIDIINKDKRDMVIEAVLLALLFGNRDSYVHSLMIDPALNETIIKILLTGSQLSLKISDSFYGSLVNLNSDRLCTFEQSSFMFLILVARSIPLFTLLYEHGRRIPNDSHKNFNEFRYMLALGAVLHLNHDLYNWIIDEFYKENEEEFIAELYLRNQLNRDSYDTLNHIILDAFKVFKLSAKMI